jgi:hypothetical protein
MTALVEEIGRGSKDVLRHRGTPDSIERMKHLSNRDENLAAYIECREWYYKNHEDPLLIRVTRAEAIDLRMASGNRTVRWIVDGEEHRG